MRGRTSEIRAVGGTGLALRSLSFASLTRTPAGRRGLNLTMLIRKAQMTGQTRKVA